MTTETEVSEIADKLTDAQREALDWVRPHSVIAPYRRGGADLPGLGLVEVNRGFFSITPLGLAVRDLLRSRATKEPRK